MFSQLSEEYGKEEGQKGKKVKGVMEESRVCGREEGVSNEETKCHTHY